MTIAALRGAADEQARRQIEALVLTGVLLAATILAAVLAGAEPFRPDSFGPGQDARAYWVADATAPYEPASVGRESAYLYSPAFLQVIAPLRSLPWDAFLGLWVMLLLGVTFVLARPLLFAPVLVLVFVELWGGNIHLLLAAAVVVGFRWPAAWAFVLMTKVTPGIGLLWFAARREWRQLGVAAMATGVVAGVSYLVAPDLWHGWVDLLTGSAGSSTVAGSVPIPLAARLPVAALLIVFAARTDRQWLLPAAVMLALPVLWWGGLSMLAGCVALKRTDAEEWVLRRLRDLGVDDEPGPHQATLAGT